MDDLKAAIKQAYQEHGSPQEEICATAQQIYRMA
jgi:hypothetical protein